MEGTMFKGCFVAIVTPFRDGAVDFPALDELIDYLIEGGISGIVPCGTTGESPTLTQDEHAAIVSAVVKRVRKRVPVVAGTGTNCTEKTLELSQTSAKAGVDGLMLVSPYYNRPSQRGLYEHFSFIAQAVPLPILLYNIPGRTGVEISVETIARLHSDHRNIVAVKHATGSVDGASELASASDITILSGDDSLTLPLMSVGATGVVSVVGNLLPKEMSAMTGAALKGDWESARVWHKKLFPICRDLLKLDTNPIPIKTALAMRGMMAEEFRLPMCSMDAARKEKLRAVIAQFPSAAPAGRTA